MSSLCKWVLVFVCVCIPALAPGSAGAAIIPELDLWMTGELVGNQLTVEVHRTNTGFGLGGLAYDVQFNETLEMTRQYGSFGWVANDGTYDNSDPLDGAAPTNRASAVFDTVYEVPGGEFPADTSGIVEVLTFTNIDLASSRWIYVDILDNPRLQASNGSGLDLEGDLQGVIYPRPQAGLPEEHTFGVFVPEPATVIILWLGALVALKRRSA